MVQNGRLFDFILRIIEKKQEDDQDRLLWEFYLNKVDMMTFDEFLRKAKMSRQDVPKIDAKKTFEKSQKILQGFSPAEKGETL